MKIALTHTSYANEHKKKMIKHNERLEFLGDSVLSLIITTYLFKNLSNIPEGELSRIRSTIVCENSLKLSGDEFNLSQYNNVLKNNFEDILKTRAFIKNKENIDLLKLVDLARKSDIEASRELIVVVSRYKNNIPEISKQVKFLLENQELFNEVRKTLENREEGSH